MDKILLKDFIFKTKIKDHFLIKKSILDEIENDNSDTLIVNDRYYSDVISKLDWDDGENCERNWVKIFLPHFYNCINEFLLETSYIDIELNKIWYQQYLTNNSHSWHIHADQYTGVYYLEFPEKSSRTQLIFPYDKSINEIDAEEGDIIFFPSHIIHRGPSNNSDRKTIISFNFSIGNDNYDDDLNYEVLYSE